MQSGRDGIFYEEFMARNVESLLLRRGIPNTMARPHRQNAPRTTGEVSPADYTKQKKWPRGRPMNETKTNRPEVVQKAGFETISTAVLGPA